VCISTNTDHESLITTITSQIRFVRLARVLWNQQSNKLVVVSKFHEAQWNERNVPQVLAHRVAYLNGMIGVNLKVAG